jgi:hypothetical protein
LVVPIAHESTHMPIEHTWPAAQAFPHMPQWARSVCTSRHEPEQFESPDAHDSTHMPIEHTCPSAQAFPHAPQLVRSF